MGEGVVLPDDLSIVADIDEDIILDQIEEAAAKTPFVIVDLEGTAAKIVLLAVRQTDLGVIPMQGPSSTLSRQAGRSGS